MSQVRSTGEKTTSTGKMGKLQVWTFSRRARVCGSKSSSSPVEGAAIKGEQVVIVMVKLVTLRNGTVPTAVMVYSGSNDDLLTTTV